MGVIVSGMELPKRCDECRFCVNQKTNDYGSYGKCLLQNESVDCLVWSRDTNCPLKSVDGLIKKIVNSPSDVGQNMYKTKYDGAARRQNEIIEIIKEYCEVGE